MGWTSEVRFHVGAPLCVIRRLRQRFTHKGFQNFFVDFKSNPRYNDALETFAAYTLEKDIQSAGTGVGKNACGELVYEFSIWKDNICEVAQHFLVLLEKTLTDELGKTWRNVRGLSSSRNFVRAWSTLGHSEEACFDLMPALLSAQGDSKLLYDDNEHEGLLMDLFFRGEESERTPPSAYINLSKFTEFTAELEAWHKECEPDAFRCDNGGVGATVRLRGLEKKPELNGKLGIVVDAVDLETKRWPVRLAQAEGSEEPSLISVRRRNLELVDLHIPRDSMPGTSSTSMAQSPMQSECRGSPFQGEFLSGFRGGFFQQQAASKPETNKAPQTPEKCEAPQRRQREVHAAKKHDRPSCCFWLQGKCRFGSRCRYSHARSATGICHFGSTCHFRHGHSKEEAKEFRERSHEGFLQNTELHGFGGLFGRPDPDNLYNAAREQKQLGNTMKAVELLFTAIQIDATMGPEFTRKADRERANAHLEKWAFRRPETMDQVLKLFHRVNKSLGLEDFSSESEDESEEESQSMFGFGKGMMGFSAAECDELLMQGIKPWDDDAAAAASVLFGHDEYF